MRIPGTQTHGHRAVNIRKCLRRNDSGLSWFKFAVVLGMTCCLCGTAQGASDSGTGSKDSSPFIGAIADQTVDEDTLTISIPILYGDAETPAPQLKLRVASSNPKLLPEANVTFSDTTPRQMLMVPAHDQYGVATVTLTVEDTQGNSASQSFRLTVNPVNDPPSLTGLDSLTFLENGSPQTVSLVVTDPESQPEELIVSVDSSNPALIPLENIKLDGIGKDRTLSVSPAPDQSGAALVVLVARDPEGAETRLKINIRVTSVNSAPRLSRIPDQHVFVNQVLDSIPLTLFDDKTPTSEIRLEGFSLNPSLVPDGGITFGVSEDQPTISIHPTKNLTGKSLITVRAYDRENLESATSFLLTVDPINLPPEIAGLVNVAVDQDTAEGPISFVVTDADGPAELIRVEASSSNLDLVPLAGIRLGGTGKDRSFTILPSLGASGTAVITLLATDSAGSQGRATFILTVRAASLRPIAQARSLVVTEDNPMTFALEGKSPSGNSLAFAIVTKPQKGVLTGEPPFLTYVPNPNASGSDSFLFKVTEGSLESVPANLTITIQEINDSPTISSISNRTSEPGTAIGPIQFTVDDVETPPGQLRVTGHSSNPNLVPDLNIVIAGQDKVRTVTIFPTPDKSGAVVITLTVDDGGGLSARTTFEVSVVGASSAPAAEAQSLVTLEDLAVAISLRGHDPDGAVLGFTIVDLPSKGTLLGVAPNLVYRPKANESGQDRFTFKVKNATGESAATAVDILILPVNDPPATHSQSYTIKEDTSQEIELGASDPDSNSLVYEIVNSPTRGKLSGTPPRLIYTPNPDENGADQFTFIASDGELTSASGTIRITIEPVNDAPVALGSFVSAPEDSVIPITLKAHDVDGDPLTYSIVTLPAKGLLAGNPPDLVYVPNANTTGLDRFTFHVSDGKLLSEQAVVTVMVIPVNDPPVAESQFISLAEDSSAEILLNARDVDADPLTFIIVNGPSKGSISGTLPRLTYRPDRDFNGIDSFTYKVSDGVSESPSATITLSVRPVNDPPVAADQYVTLNEDASQGILLMAHDVDGDLLTYRVIDAPQNGSISGVAPYLVYTPARDFNGEDRFTFSASDGQLESLPATVKISVRPVNDAPIAINQFLNVPQGRSQLVSLTGTDVDGGTVQFILTSLPTKGSLSGTPPNLVYLPNPNERGLDSFSFKVSDGVLESSPGTIQLVLTEKTSGPTISKIADQNSRNGEPTAKLPFAVRDLQTAPDKLVVAASSSNPGLVPVRNIVLEGSGESRTVQVTPANSKPGTATITLVVWDEDGLADSAQFSVTVVTETRTPIAENLSLSTSEDISLPIELKASDADKNPLTFTITSPPTKGHLSGSPPSLVYIPDSNVSGGDAFTFKARNDSSESAPATVTIQIVPINDSPSISKVSDQIVQDGQDIGPIRFEVSDPDTPLENLRLSVSFSAPSLIRTDSVVIEGSGTTRTLKAASAPGKSGVTSVKVSVTDGDLSATAEFQLTVLAPNQPPTIELVTPVDLSVLDPTTSPVLEAKASDPDGAIQRVDFFAGNTLIGTSTMTPYRFTWRYPTKGQYALTAKAVDDRGTESASASVNIRVEQTAGSVAVLTGGDDPDLALVRRYLFELPVRWAMIPHAEAKSDELLRQYNAVLWHQPSGAELQASDLSLLESLARLGTPLYFLGDSLLASRKNLQQSERTRWQTLLHLKPGGTSWLNQITLIEETDPPVVKNGPMGSVARFAYPVAAQQSGVQSGLPGEVVLGRSGTFDILVASVDAQSSARTFTHHLRLSGASDAFGTAEQAKLFKNAMTWLLDKQYFMDLSVEVESPAATVAVGQTFQYSIVVRHSGESAASQVAVLDALPPQISLVRAENAAGTWSQSDGTAVFELGSFKSGETKTLVVTARANQAGSFSHQVSLQMLGRDLVPENNSFDAVIQVVGVPASLPKLIVKRENQGTIRIEMPASGVGVSYALEASDDLMHWSRLDVGTIGPATAVTLSSVTGPHRFFRAVSSNTPTAIAPADPR